MTHHQSLCEQINRLKKENPKHRVIVFMNHIDFTTLEKMNELPAQVVISQQVKPGEIKMQLIPEKYIMRQIRKKKIKSFIQKIKSWVKRKILRSK